MESRGNGGTPALDRFVTGFDYPMYIATVAGDGTPGDGTGGAPGDGTGGAAGGGPAGCLVGFATQCSIHPFRFLICLSKENRTYRAAHEADLILVHALDRHQHALAALFGAETGDEVDKFARCAWRPGPGGAPLLTGCPRWFAGRVLDRVDLGDHVGHLLAPVDAHVDDDITEPDDDRQASARRPLMFSDVTDLKAGHPA